MLSRVELWVKYCANNQRDNGDLWYHDQPKGQTKHDQVDAVHPPQEDEIGGYRRAKMTWKAKEILP